MSVLVYVYVRSPTSSRSKCLIWYLSHEVLLPIGLVFRVGLSSRAYLVYVMMSGLYIHGNYVKLDYRMNNPQLNI